MTVLFRRFFLAGVALLCGFASERAGAAVVTYAFTGRVTAVTGPLYGANPALNDAVTGYWSYDTSVADTEPHPVYGFYPQSIANGVTVNIAGVSFTQSNYSVDVGNAYPADAIRTTHGLQVEPVFADGTATHDLSMLLELTDSTLTAYSSDQLPASIDLAVFDASRGYVRDFVTSANGTNQIDFVIDSMQLVPEPSSLAMLVLGAGGLLAVSRRVRSRRV